MWISNLCGEIGALVKYRSLSEIKKINYFCTNEEKCSSELKRFCKFFDFLIRNICRNFKKKFHAHR